MPDPHSLTPEERAATFHEWEATLLLRGPEAKLAVPNFLTTAFGDDTRRRWQEGKNRTAAPDVTVRAVTTAVIEQTKSLDSLRSLAWFLNGGLLRSGHTAESAGRLVASVLAIFTGDEDSVFHAALDRHHEGELEAFCAERAGVSPEYAGALYPALGKRNEWRNPNGYGPKPH